MSDELFAKFVRGEISKATYENGGKVTEFEIGARVKTKSGKLGTVANIFMDGDGIGVIHDEHMGGHNLEGRCKSGFGWNYHKDSLELV